MLRKYARKLGRKAIGFVKGLNGDKLAALGAAGASWAIPAAAPYFVAAVKPVGSFINWAFDRADEALKSKKPTFGNPLLKNPQRKRDFYNTPTPQIAHKRFKPEDGVEAPRYIQVDGQADGQVIPRLWPTTAEY